MLRLLGLVMLLSVLPVTGFANDRPLPPPECAPRYFDDLPKWQQWTRGLGAHWLASARAGEDRRIGNDPRVLRYLDRLYLAREDGGVVTLVDCAFTPFFVYDHFDDTGGFYVVARSDSHNFYYLAISRATGAELVIFTKPDWAPDKKRFAHGGCGQMIGPPNELYVVRQTEQGPKAEASVQLPCPTAGQCDFSWQSDSAISVSCPVDMKSDRVKFRFVFESETWTKVPD